MLIGLVRQDYVGLPCALLVRAL